MRWQHCLDHADNIQKPAKSDCLLGVVTQPTDCRLSETRLEHEPVDDRHVSPGLDELHRCLVPSLGDRAQQWRLPPHVDRIDVIADVMRQQHPHALRMPMMRGVMQRRVEFVVPGRDVTSGVQQRRHDVDEAATRRKHQGRVVVLLLCVRRTAGRQEALHDAHVTCPHGHMERRATAAARHVDVTAPL